MKKYLFLIIGVAVLLSPNKTEAQIDGGQLGAWYMYFWDVDLENSPWGLQGDFQHRSWDALGDLEQRLLRGGVTYTPAESSVKFTLGFAYILTGEFGGSDSTSEESRIYQEMLLPHKVASRFYFAHRFRFEQRYVEGQDFRTRYRYNIFLNIPLNQTELAEGAIYLALYNELFINGQKGIGDGKSVELFDRDRIYGGLGYVIKKQFRVQLGYMRQITNSWDKGQVQFSIHHKF